MKFTKALIIFISVFIFYIIFTGLLNTLTIFTGFVTALIMTIIVEYLDVFDISLSLGDLKRTIHIVKFIVFFIKTEIVEHLKVAKIILSRKISINPAIVEIPTILRSDIALTIAALTITDTPGTVAIDIDKEKGLFYIHWLNQEVFEPKEIKRRILGDLEILVKNIVE
jgi:multicomponent Na+:H+ antiporter subunit E